MNSAKTIRIFVSSTFRDMDTERDALRNLIEPRLNEALSKYSIDVKLIDLRHTVETSKKLTIEQREQRVFQICMDEIESCSPYFIALIGHRYGWIPDLKKMGISEKYEKVQRDDFTNGKDKISVTSYELLSGLFRGNEINKRSLVYLRNNDSYGKVKPENRSDYFEDTEEGIALSMGLRDFLKRNFQAGGEREILKQYTLDPTGEDKAELKKWCDHVYKDIMLMLDEDIEKSEKLNPVQAAHHKYIQGLVYNFQGREEEIKRCLRFLDEGKPCNIISTEDGVGLSALLCKIYDIKSKDPKNTCVFVSNQASAELNSYEDEVRYVCKEIEHKAGIKDERHKDRYTLLYLDFLTKKCAKAKKNLILFWDNYDIGPEWLNHLYYETSLYPKTTITTTKLSDKELAQKEKEGFVNIVHIGNFSQNDVQEIIGNRRKSYVQSIVDRPSSRNPQWLSMATTIYDNLNHVDYQNIRVLTGTDQEGNIDAYICELVSQFPDDVEHLFGFWLSKLSVLFGTDFANAYISAMSITAGGWSDSEIAAVIGYPEDWCIYFRQMLGRQIIMPSDNGSWVLIQLLKVIGLRKCDSERIVPIARRAYNLLIHNNIKDQYFKGNMFVLSLVSREYNYCLEYLADYGNALEDRLRGFKPQDLADMQLSVWMESCPRIMEQSLSDFIENNPFNRTQVVGFIHLLDNLSERGFTKEHLIYSSKLLNKLRDLDPNNNNADVSLARAVIYENRHKLNESIKDARRGAADDLTQGIDICKKHLRNNSRIQLLYLKLFRLKIMKYVDPNIQLHSIEKDVISLYEDGVIKIDPHETETIVEYCSLLDIASQSYMREGDIARAVHFASVAIDMCEDSMPLFTHETTDFQDDWQRWTLQEKCLDSVWLLCRLHFEDKRIIGNKIIDIIAKSLKLCQEWSMRSDERPSLHVKYYAVTCCQIVLLSKTDAVKAQELFDTGMRMMVLMNDPHNSIKRIDSAHSYTISLAWLLLSRLYLMYIRDEEVVTIHAYGLFDGKNMDATTIDAIFDEISMEWNETDVPSPLLNVNYIYLYFSYIYAKILAKNEHVEKKRLVDLINKHVAAYNKFEQGNVMLIPRFRKELQQMLSGNDQDDNNDYDDKGKFNIQIIEDYYNERNYKAAEETCMELIDKLSRMPQQDYTMLSRLYHIAGKIQSEKQVWFKAYTYLERSVNCYERAIKQKKTISVVPIQVYLDLANAYTQSDNTHSAIRVLSNALKRYEQAGMDKTKEYTSLKHVLARLTANKESAPENKEMSAKPQQQPDFSMQKEKKKISFFRRLKLIIIGE